LFFASLSKVHCRSGLLSTGNRIFGRVQLRGRNLVPKPPARTTAFKYPTPNQIADLYSVGA
jgi:hypothetical protein